MLLELFGAIQWWHWLVLGMTLLAIEIAAPVSWFLWISLAAFAMVPVVLVLPGLGWPAQLVLFGLASVGTLFVGRAYFKGNAARTDTPMLNRRGEQYIGRTFTLTDAIDNGYGTVQVDDTRWRVSGPELPVGQHVRVIGVEGTVFRVEAAG